MSATMNMSEILETIKDLETRLGVLRKLVEPAAAAKPKKRGPKPRAPDAPKREPNDWIKFSSRVRKLLNDGGEETAFKMAKHVLSFASALRAKKADSEWTDEEILAERKDWDPDLAVATAAATLTEEEVEEHRAEGRRLMAEAVAAGKDPTEAVDAWLKTLSKELAAAAAPTPPTKEKGKPGRKKMSEEEKAAAAKAREDARKAMSEDEKKAVAEKKAAKAAARKAAKVAWDEKPPTVLGEDLESVTSVEQ